MGQRHCAGWRFSRTVVGTVEMRQVSAGLKIGDRGPRTERRETHREHCWVQILEEMSGPSLAHFKLSYLSCC